MEKICQPVDRFHFRDQWLRKFLRTKKNTFSLHEKRVQLQLGLFLTLDLLDPIIGEVSKM